RIALNESLNLLRRNAREEPLDDEIELPGPESADPEWQASEAQQSARVQKALMRMKVDDRVMLTLRHFAELSYREIGAILDLEDKTVKSRLFEARQRMRGLLEDLRTA
ncbi:MAG TPA: sigma-70 family RNA polymerase sigma factor, partial [Usitatibacter sp.]|nr:sigma-70 family RNA polymerase sigma factor [Usitatibacter sp.]